jgi:hypothetical protein
LRILFDNSTPRGPAKALNRQHSVFEARAEGWDQLTNGELLQAAEAAGFDIFVTPDQNNRYQQNLTGRKIALVVLSKGQWPYVRNHLAEIAAAVDAATPGSYMEVETLDPNER